MEKIDRVFQERKQLLNIILSTAITFSVVGMGYVDSKINDYNISLINRQNEINNILINSIGLQNQADIAQIFQIHAKTFERDVTFDVNNPPEIAKLINEYQSGKISKEEIFMSFAKYYRKESDELKTYSNYKASELNVMYNTGAVWKFINWNFIKNGLNLFQIIATLFLAYINITSSLSLVPNRKTVSK